MTIRNKLQNKTPHERATTKGKEIARVCKKGQYNRGKLRIEIVNTNPIEGGIEVFARAWKNGKQIGFGKDGSVDIERFRIFNPPVLVDDQNGDIVREWVDEDTGETKQRKLREDPQEALIQVIEHNLSVMKNVHSSERIEKGKRGNTTSTFYPEPGVTVDGVILRIGSGWSDTRSGTGTNGPNFNVETNDNFFQRRNSLLGRVILLFDTSSLGSDNILSAILSQRLWMSSADTNSNALLVITTSNPASNNELVLSDFEIAKFGSTKLSNTQTILTSDTTEAWKDFTFNSSGISAINQSGISKFAVRFEDDVDNTDPGSNTSRVIQRYSQTSGTSQDPKLVVEHEAGTIELNLTEIIGVGDSVAINKNVVRAFSETIGLIDTIATQFTAIVLREVVAVSDALTRQTQRILREFVSVTGRVARATQRIFSELVGIRDSVSPTFFILAQEIITARDFVARQTSRLFLEVVNITDAIFRELSAVRVFQESLALTDTVLRSTQRLFSEMVAITDTSIRAIMQMFTERIGLIGNTIFQSMRMLVERIGLSDTFAKLGVFTRTLTERVSLVSNITRQLSRALRERVVVKNEAFEIAANFVRTFNETLRIVPDFLTRMARKIRPFITNLLSRTKDKTVLKSKGE